MPKYSTKRSFEGPFASEEPLEDLDEFYRANGYRRRIQRSTENPSDDAEQADRALQFVRGRDAAGWWSSNMAQLPTEIEAVRRDGTVQIRYEVDVTGQRLTDEDRQFWSREIQAARQHLRNPDRRPRDLRHEEAKRAEQTRRRMLSYGIWGAIIAFLFVLLVNRFVTTF